MISNRLRPRLLGLALLAGATGSAGGSRSVVARSDATPEASPQASPAAAGGPRSVDGAYLLPDDPTATVIDLTFGNATLPPEYQYGYEVTIDASGHADIAISPVGSRAGTPSVEPIQRTEEIGADGLQKLLAELDAIGYFALPPRDPDRILIGGEVDAIEVTLADGDWVVNSWSLDTAGQRDRFAAAHLTILKAVGVESPPDLGR
jgi:hypothetical protein